MVCFGGAQRGFTTGGAGHSQLVTTVCFGEGATTQVQIMLTLKTLTNSLRLLACVVAAAFVFGSGASTFSSYANDAAYDSVKVGESEAAVIDRFHGEPSERDRRGSTYGRYTSTPCAGTCFERLWYENRLSLVDEAWFVEVDNGLRVIDKGKISSP